MKTITVLKSAFLFGIFSASIAGCGSGNDPFLMLGDPGAVPSLGLPSSSLTFASAFNANQDSIGVNAGGGLPVIAPAAGTIAKIESATTPINGYHVWIYHTAHLMSRLTVPTTVVPTVRVGDYVSDGQAIAQLSIGSLVYMGVFFNSSAVCPVGFLKASARALIAASISCN